MTTSTKFSRNMEPKAPENSAKRPALPYKRLRHFLFLALFLAGCAFKPTYPADTVIPAVEAICRDEYKLDAIAKLTGKTLGLLVYKDALLDETGHISSKEIQDELND